MIGPEEEHRQPAVGPQQCVRRRRVRRGGRSRGGGRCRRGRRGRGRRRVGRQLASDDRGCARRRWRGRAAPRTETVMTVTRTTGRTRPPMARTRVLAAMDRQAARMRDMPRPYQTAPECPPVRWSRDRVRPPPARHRPDTGHVQSAPARPGGAPGGIGCDPSPHRRPARRPDDRRCDHGGRPVHRPVHRPVRPRRVAGDVGDGRCERDPRGNGLRHRRRRRAVDPGAVPTQGPLVAAPEALDVISAVVLLAVVVFTVLFLFKLPNVSRLFLLLLFPAQAALTIAIRWAIGLVFLRLRARASTPATC